MHLIVKCLVKKIQLEIIFGEYEMFSIWRNPLERVESDPRQTLIAIHEKTVKGERLRRKICFEDGYINKRNNRKYYTQSKEGMIVEVYPTEWNCKQTGFRIVLAYLIDLLNPEIRISIDLQKYPSIDRALRIMSVFTKKIVFVQYHTTTIDEKQWGSLIRRTSVKDVVSFKVTNEIKELERSYQHIQLCCGRLLTIGHLPFINSVALELKRVALSDEKIRIFLRSLGTGGNPTLEYISFQLQGKVNLNAIVEDFEVVEMGIMRKFKNCKLNVECRSGVTIKLSNGVTCSLEVDKILSRTVYSQRKLTGYYDDLLKIFIWR